MAGSRVLTVGVGPTFATRWLIPRLADFQKEEPDIEVRFATGGATLPYNDDWTCGIRLGDGDWPGFVAERLFAADFTPVCSPATGEAAEDAGRFAGRDTAARRACGGRMAALVQGGGLSKIRVKGPEFEYYGQALQAAADGVGVAIGISPYVDDDLKAGRLVAPFAQSVSKGEHWYLIYRDGRKDEAAFVAFRAWIMRAARRESYCALRLGLHRLAARRVGVGHALRHEGSCASRPRASDRRRRTLQVSIFSLRRRSEGRRG